MAKNRKLDKKNIVGYAFKVFWAIIFILLIVFFVITGIPKDIGADRQYKCDVKSLNINTKIVINDDKGNTLTAKGNIIRLIEDPLTLYNNQNQKIFYADDTYHLIKQDAHCIIGENDEKLELVGDFNIFGDSYVIYRDGIEIAKAKFNALNTRGKLCDNDGNIIADYTSRFLFNDYIVQTKKNSSLSEEAILMIFASYYSDQHADKG